MRQYYLEFASFYWLRTNTAGGNTSPLSVTFKYINYSILEYPTGNKYRHLKLFLCETKSKRWSFFQ